jgi:hypothetical protein
MTKSFNCMRIHISISTLLVTVYRRHSDTQLLPVVVANLKGYVIASHDVGARDSLSYLSMSRFDGIWLSPSIRPIDRVVYAGHHHCPTAAPLATHTNVLVAELSKLWTPFVSSVLA